VNRFLFAGLLLAIAMIGARANFDDPSKELCERWTEHAREYQSALRSGNHDYSGPVFQDWAYVSGYLAGAGYASGDFRPRFGEVMIMMDSYCRENPSSLVAYVTTIIVQYLAKHPEP